MQPAHPSATSAEWRASREPRGSAPAAAISDAEIESWEGVGECRCLDGACIRMESKRQPSLPAQSRDSAAAPSSSHPKGWAFESLLQQPLLPMDPMTPSYDRPSSLCIL